MSDAFWDWWQHLPRSIDPNLLQIGSFQLRYYGLMYIVAFVLTYFLLVYRSRKDDFAWYTPERIQDLMVWFIVGTILGGRLGYVLFYDLAYFAAHPLEIFLPFDVSDGFRFTGISGMSYHGGVIGVVTAGYLFSRRHKLPFVQMIDFVAPAAPLGYTFGRLGNFINGELYGRVTTAPWGMFFPLDPTHQLRHPSQLYEAFFEGIFLFVLLWSVRNHPRCRGGLLGLYLIGYGMVRFFIEFYREPDPHLMFVLGPLTMGQVLCTLMMLIGLVVYVIGRRIAQRSAVP
ncbi:MAG: prolipoprotein diacylglyceryl transferase [Desulfobacterales bacterium]|jgi:phosphatidylglycerol:prolipoprotein diacylglycerol transferase